MKIKLYQFRPKTFIGAKNGPVFAGICGDSWPLAAHGWDEAKSAGNQGQVYLQPSLRCVILGAENNGRF